MSTPERRAMIDPDNDNLSVRRQCELLQLARSGVYRPKPDMAASDLAVMRRIDELHVEMPFYGSLQRDNEAASVASIRMRMPMAWNAGRA